MLKIPFYLHYANPLAPPWLYIPISQRDRFSQDRLSNTHVISSVGLSMDQIFSRPNLISLMSDSQWTKGENIDSNLLFSWLRNSSFSSCVNVMTTIHSLICLTSFCNTLYCLVSSTHILFLLFP